jgi:hypothetical protein
LKRSLIKIGKIVLYTATGILLLLITAVLLLRLPAVQQYITDKATAYVSEKTHTTVRIGKLYVGFPKNIVIEELYAEDLNKDTLIYLKELDVNVGLWQLLNNKLMVNSLELDGLAANVIRTLPDSSFNFDFIIQAFAGKKEPDAEVKDTDTSASSFTIDADEIHLTNLRLLYDDAVNGLYTKGVIGELEIDVDEIDLKQLRFGVDELFLARTDAVFEIRKQTKEAADTSTGGMLPVLAVNKLRMESTVFGFHHIPDSSYFDFKVGNLLLEPNEIDLNKQWIDVKTLTLSGGEAHIAMQQKKEKAGNTDDTTGTQNWRCAAGNVSISNTSFSYNITNIPATHRGMDYNHLDAKQIVLEGKDLYYSPSLIKGTVKQIALTEHSGLEVKKLRTSFVYDSTHAELANLFVQTNHSTISNYAFISYPSIASLGNDVGQAHVKLNLKGSKASVKDVLLFAPDLVKQPVLAKNKDAVIVLSGKINGKINDLVAGNLLVQTASQTSIACDARLKGLPDASKLWFDINLRSLTTGRKDLEQLLPDSTIPATIRVPDQLVLQGKATGSLKQMIADVSLKSSDGNATIEGTYEEKNAVPAYTINLHTDELNAGRILKQDPLLGKVTLAAKAKGQSFKPETIIADANAEIAKLEIKGYAYSAISIDATARSGLYKTDLTIADKNLSLQLNAEASILKDSSFLKLLLDMKGADLQNMKLARGDVRASGTLSADIKNFNVENMKGSLNIANVVLIKNAQRYKLDSLIVITFNEKRKSKLSIKNSIVQVEYKGSTGLHEVTAVVKNHVARYLGRTKYIADTVEQDFTCTITVVPHPILNEVLLPGLTRFSGIAVVSSFNSSQQQLAVAVNSSYIQYGDQAINDLNVKIVSDEDKVTYDVSVAGISSGQVFLPKTSLSGTARDNVIDFSLSVIHPDSGNRLLIAGKIDQQKEEETRISISDESHCV